MDSINTPNIPPFVAPCKAICISNSGGWWNENDIPQDGPIYNEIVTIVSVGFCEINNLWYVQLAEYPTDDKDGYIARVFAPIQEQKLKLVTLTKILEKERENVIITAN